MIYNISTQIDPCTKKLKSKEKFYKVKIPNSIKMLIKKCLKKDPKKRPTINKIVYYFSEIKKLKNLFETEVDYF
jgi:serine/threonine protein kinase